MFTDIYYIINIKINYLDEAIIAKDSNKVILTVLFALCLVLLFKLKKYVLSTE